MAAHPTHTADQAKAAASPPDDKRWKVVEATMRRHGYAPHALIETLHTVQEGYGYLDEPELRRVSAALRVPLSRVYGVATFYHLFTLKPQGEHSCVVCTGTACYIKGIPAILQAIEDEFHISPGETTKDNKLSLLTARCLGACGLAPAGVFDGNVGGRLTPADAVARLHSIVESAAPEREAAHDA
jgi:bidirectional [NiFe] hydrogenase diaphorase subunit